MRLANRPIVEKQVSSEDANASTHGDVKLPTPATINERSEPSEDARSDPETGNSAPASTPLETVPAASEISDPANVPANPVEIPLQQVLEPHPIVPLGLVELLPTSPIDSSPVIHEAKVREHGTVVRESEQTQPNPASPLIIGLNEDENCTPFDAPERQLPTLHSHTSSVDAVIDVGKSAERATVTDNQRDEAHAPLAPLDVTTETLPATAPAPCADAELDIREQTEPSLTGSEPPAKARRFVEPKPSPTTKVSTRSQRDPDSKPRTDATLPIRLQLVFGRGWTVKTLALVAHRRDGMPNTIDVASTHGRLKLSEWNADSYEPVSIMSVPDALSDGVVWQSRNGAQQWRWELSRRELYVLAAGDEFGLRGFVTRRKDQRLWLNTQHLVLAREALREQILVALGEAGCAAPEISDSTSPAVPTGWILLRNVVPTRAVPMVDERDILNVLRPAHEHEPQFLGGIRLERNVWLVGFPPRIRFTGELGNDFQVLIDDKPAWLASDGAFEAPDWDAEGEHRLWFGGRAEPYALRTMKEDWQSWHAHDLGAGAAICGASTNQIDGARWRQVRIPAANPLLVGARPGEIFCCQSRYDVRSPTILALVPFAPVWALPVDPIHADKRSVRLVPLDSLEPVAPVEHSKRMRRMNDSMRRWVAVVNDAGRKQLEFSTESDEAKALWRRYRVMAKHLWKRMR